MSQQAPLTWQEMRDAVRTKHADAVIRRALAQFLVCIGSPFEHVISDARPTEPEAWASAYARLFPSAAVSIPSVDWGDDEKVVRGRWLDALCEAGDVPTSGSFRIHSRGKEPGQNIILGWGQTIDLAWRAARQHPTVQAFKRKWNPEYQGGTDARLDNNGHDCGDGDGSDRGIAIIAGAHPDRALGTQEVAERGAFEKWCKIQGYRDLTTTRPPDTYGNQQVQRMFDAWQARASLAPAPEPPEDNDFLAAAYREANAPEPVEAGDEPLKCTGPSSDARDCPVHRHDVYPSPAGDADDIEFANRHTSATPEPAKTSAAPSDYGNTHCEEPTCGADIGHLGPHTASVNGPQAALLADAQREIVKLTETLAKDRALWQLTANDAADADAKVEQLQAELAALKEKNDGNK